jgi:putative phosphoribosyl transferase
MFAEQHAFADRRDAGRKLAMAVAKLDLDNPIVLALPRGGVPVAAEVAKVLRAPLDLLLVRKIGAPGQEEYAIGALVDGDDPQVVLNDEVMALVQPPPGYIDAEVKRQLAELERRRKAYFGSRKAPVLRGRTVVVVDDGVATGSTVTAALRALLRSKAAKTVLAVPIAPEDTIAKLREEADEVVCLSMPAVFRAVGLHYADFRQTTDEEVIALLQPGRLPRPETQS